MNKDKIAQLRQKVAIYRGLRKIRVEAELVWLLATESSTEARELADDAIHRARELLQRAEERKNDAAQYESALAWILRAKAYALVHIPQFTEGLRLLDEALHLFRKVDDNLELIRTHDLKHSCLRDLKEFSAARAELEFALELGRQSGIHQEDAGILGSMGMVDLLLGNYDVARKEFEEALVQIRNKGDINAEIEVLYSLGTLFESSGDPRKAVETYRRALDLARQHRAADATQMLHLTWVYARANASLGATAMAIDCMNEGIAMARDASLHYIEANFSFHRGILQSGSAEYAQAAEALYRALKVFDGRSSVDGSAACLALLGALFAACEERGIADEYFGACCRLLDDIDLQKREGDVTLLGIAVQTLALQRSACLDAPRFLAYLGDIRDRYPLREYKNKYLTLRQSVDALLVAAGSLDIARAEMAKTLKLSRELNYLDFQCESHFRLGRLLGDMREFSEAIEQLQAALSLARQVGYQDRERQIHRHLSLIHEEQGRSAEAQRHRQSEEVLARQTMDVQTTVLLKNLHLTKEVERREQEIQGLRADFQSMEENNAALQRLLDTKSAHTAHLVSVLNKIAKSLRQNAGSEDPVTRQILADIEAAAGDDSWQEFEKEAREQDDDFMLRLSRDYPALTSAERRVCALIRVNTTTKDLSRMLNVSPRTIQAYRYRIRKKLKLPAEVDLNAHILTL